MSASINKTFKIVFSTILLLASFNLFITRAQLPDVYEQTTSVQAYVHYDFDEDGMHNWWELLYGLDPLDPSDAALDLDGDNLINLVEFYYLTSPLNRDTDGGGVWDDLEIKLKKNPLDPTDDFTEIRNSPPPNEPTDSRGDSDGDGLSNTLEDELGTNKQSIDTDSDGLNDYDEVYKYPTNPLEPDTDFDGVNDYDELFTYHTNPNNRDSDFDGLLDSEEIFTYGTNPTYWDTDGGGMSDGDELTNGSDPRKQDDDYTFSWSVYYGNEPNDIYKSLEDNKINIYQGMDLSLEIITPQDAKQVTIKFNDKEFTTQKEYIKLKLLSPKNPGIYKLDFVLKLKTNQTVIMSKFVEVRQKGKIISRVDGTFNNLYKDIDYFTDGPIEGAKIEVYEYNEFTGEMQLFKADVGSQSDPKQAYNNPQYTDAKGTYVLPLRPGNYLIKISKAKYGTKEMLYNTKSHTVYSQDIYLTYDYDTAVWGGIYVSTFLSTWLIINLTNLLRRVINILIKRYLKHKGAH